MRARRTRNTTKAVGVTAPALALVLALGAAGDGRGDEPGRLGRLFRFGSQSQAPATPPTASASPVPSEIVLEGAPAPPSAGPTPFVNEASPSATNGQPRLVPQPRVSRGATDSDPILTRVTLGRSSEGSPFAVFLQVYADGTVIDGEGVHQVGRDGVRPVVEALSGGDLFRLKGHCGSPPTDSLEEVQMVVYERVLGRLRANAFSFSANTQGCDHAVRHVQTLLENLQVRLSRPSPSPSPASTIAAPILFNGGDAPDPSDR